MIRPSHIFITFLIWFLIPMGRVMLFGQSNENQVAEYSTSPKKTAIVITSASLLYAGSIIGLNELWYKDYPRSSFHFINDNKEWLQMDKAGHFTSAYYIGRVGYETLKWSGMNEKKSIWIGGASGLVYLTTVEIFDGFSAQWGASNGDMIANAAGSALFISQQLLWHEQRLQLKWSFHSSPYAKYNPAQMGKNFTERILKDYNGQTYWLSANVSSFGLQETRFPKWLNIAVGYGAEGMTGGNANTGVLNGISVPDSERRRQFYISPDIDLSKIKVKSKTLHWVLSSIGFIKIPMPGLLIEKEKLRFIPICF